MPRVSVVIPTYNRRQLVRQAVESVLGQTFRDFEIIVVDDGSTDDTASAIKTYGNKVQYFYAPHAGSSAARNLALEHAAGEFIAFLDSDDLWLPEKLEKQVAVMDSDSSAGLVYCFTEMMDENGVPLPEESKKRLKLHQKAEALGFSYEAMSRFCILWPSTLLIRRRFLDTSGFFDPRTESFEDWDLYLRLALAGCRFTGIREPLVRFRIHEHHRSQKEFSEGRLNMALKHLALLKEQKALSFRRKAERNLLLQLAAVSYIISDFPNCVHYTLKALRLDPFVLSDARTAKSFFASLLFAPLLSKIRQAKGQTMDSITVKV